MTTPIDPAAEEFKEEFKDRLAALLWQKNRGNQSDASRELEVKQQAFNQWMTGKAKPRGENLKRLAAWLGTTPSYLLYGDSATGNEAKFLLMWVELRDEASLLHQYRSATPRGKHQLMTMAGRIEKQPDQDLPEQPASANQG